MLYIITKRILYGFVVLILVISLVSSIIYLAPVDPTRLSFGQMSDVQTVELKKKQLGLDKSLPVQLLYYLNDLLPVSLYSNEVLGLKSFKYCTLYKGNQKSVVLKFPYLRESYQNGRKVSELIGETLPKTLILAFTAFIFAFIIGIILGLIAAMKRNTIYDRIIIAGSTLGVSLPSYIPAILFAIVFGYILSKYTGLDVQGGLYELDALGDERLQLKNLILPALALGIRPIAMITQLSRSALLDVLNQDYITTARAKGVRLKDLIMKHLLPNSSITIIAASSGWLATLLTGSYFVETIFNFKGIGELTINALSTFDIPVILGTLITTCVLYIVLNIIVDLLYLWADPRIKYQ
ncbi:MAG TPA: ABC transporter permease [Saprospiraceae bacterium]|nr:ABC transporter permease [Saprospiraceae bacterium]